MLNTELVVKSEKDRVPTLNVAPLLKAGLLGRKPVNGELVNVKLVNSAGLVADQDFYGSRDGSTIYAKEGFNDYLFDLPSLGKPTKVGVCGADFAGTSFPTARVTTTYDNGNGSLSRTAVAERPSSLAALNRLVGSFSTKKAAAESIGISTDTLRRLFQKAEALEASAKKAPKKVTTPARAPATSSNGRYGSQKKATPAPVAKKQDLSRTGGYTKKELQAALKFAGSKAGAAMELNTNPRTFGRWLENAGL